MRVLIVSADKEISHSIRSILNRHLAECPDESVVAPEIAASRAEMLNPDLILLVCQASPGEHDLAVIRGLRRVAKGFLACVGPAADGKFIIRALHEGGADQYLDISNLESELHEALKQVKSKIGEGLIKGKVIALLGASGGSGASTLAVNLATSLVKHPQTCALLDYDLESGDLASMLDLTPTQTLGEFCGNLNRIDRSLFNSMFTVHESGVQLLASPRSYDGPITVTKEGLQQALLMARSVFSRVVVDLKLDRSFREVEDSILRLADRVLVVFRLEIASLRNARKVIDRLATREVSSDRIEFIANRFGQPHEVPAALAENILGFRITHFIPNDPTTIIRANNDGIPIVMKSSWTSVSRSLSAMAREVDLRCDFEKAEVRAPPADR